ncbi:efflux transporter outer membrane subunit [Ferrimonas futtsuensis]|uniref:efflux transporter outer membrane subunit n=1 Tax=Ferrimonas futtsuensis TaxID=364764 RepID=UPI000405E485|nr:efflux transporter outer membrane subunit [Ferrimonas futtsuensis]
MRLLPLTLALILTGCAVGPDYQRPEQSLPEHFDATPGVSAHLGTLPWRRFFLDPQLQGLIEQALTDNLSLEVTRSRLQAAREQTRVTDAALYPELSLGLSAERESDSGLTNSDPEIADTFNLDGMVSWEVDLWGANRRRSEASYAQLLSSKQQLNLATLSLISDVASRYYEWLDIEQRYRISKDTARVRLEELKLARLRKENGVISGLEVRQAEVEYQSARTTLPALDFDRHQKQNQLKLLLGSYDLNAQYQLPQGLTALGITDVLAIGVPSDMLSQRPDVAVAEQQLVAASASLGVAKAALLPSFTLSGSYGIESDRLGDILDSEGVTWSLLGGLTQPLFNSGKLKAQERIAAEELKQAELSYREAILTAYTEVSDALARVRRAQSAMEAQQQLVSASQEYVRLARLRYQNGVATSLDLLDAQRQLFSAQLALSQLQRDQLLAHISLYRALGGGLAADPEPAQAG